MSETPEIREIRERALWHDLHADKGGCTVACADRSVLLAEIDRLNKSTTEARTPETVRTCRDVSTESVRDVVLWDADSDRLVQVQTLIVKHEGRLRELSLRAARGTIRDVTETEAGEAT